MSKSLYEQQLNCLDELNHCLVSLYDKYPQEMVRAAMKILFKPLVLDEESES